MNKNKLALLLVFLIIALVGCGKKNEEEQIGSVPSETEATVYETVDETIPGLEDSIFDTEAQTTEPTETEPEVTEPEKKEESGVKQPADQGTTTTSPTKKPGTTATTPTTPTTSTTPTTPPVKNEPATEPATQPDASEEKKEENATPVVPSDYEKFHDMSAAEQQAYVESFKDMDAFFDWYNQAKADYEAANPSIEVGDGKVDMGDIINGKK